MMLILFSINILPSKSNPLYLSWPETCTTSTQSGWVTSFDHLRDEFFRQQRMITPITKKRDERRLRWCGYVPHILHLTVASPWILQKSSWTTTEKQTKATMARPSEYRFQIMHIPTRLLIGNYGSHTLEERTLSSRTNAIIKTKF